MNKLLIPGVAAIALLFSLPVKAQTVVRETTTAAQPAEVVGTVTEFEPDAVMIRTEQTAAPVRYSFSKTTEYIDEAGNRVTREVVKTGAPVTLRCIKEGDHMVVNQVIVHKAVAPAPAAVTTEKTTTTTTTTEGRHERDKDKDKDRDRDRDKERR